MAFAMAVERAGMGKPGRYPTKVLCLNCGPCGEPPLRPRDRRI